VDAAVEKNGCVIPTTLPAGKIVYSPVGPLDRDFDDVRRFYDAADKGIKRLVNFVMLCLFLILVFNQCF